MVREAYCGIILPLLPVNSPNFSVSNPDFIPVEDGMPKADLEVEKSRVHKEVWDFLQGIFG